MYEVKMNKTRKLVESALMSALVGVYVLINRQTAGMLSSFIFIIPLPMVYLSYKYDVKTTLMSAFGAFVMSFIFGDLPTVIIVFAECIIGLVYGSGLKKNDKSSTLLFRIILLSILINFITLVLFASFFGYDIVGEANEINKILVTVMGQANIKSLGIDMKMLIEVMIIASILLTGVLEGYLIHISSRLLLSRLNFKISKPTPIFLYKPNTFSGYIALFAVLLLFYVMKIKIDNQILQYALLFIGLLGHAYLIGYGCIACIVLIKVYLEPSNLLGALFVVFAVIFLNAGLLILGFIYITTNMREKALERIINVSQNRSN